jgi:PAS domain S-box-containing protein
MSGKPTYEELEQKVRALEQIASEHKRAANALGESEERFRNLFENMSSGVAVYEAAEDGEDFVFKDFNKAAEKIEQIDKDDLIGKSVSRVFPGVVEFGLLNVFKRVWRTGVPEHYPIQLYKDQRIEGWRENKVYRLLSGDIVAIFDDFTQRKRVEAELKESEKRYRSIVGVIPDLIIKLDREGVYLDIISPTDELLFLPKEKLLGSKIADIMPEEVAARSMECLRKCLDDQVLQVVEYELQVPAGKLYFESRSVPLSENIAYALVRDVTDQKRVEKEKANLIKELQDALGQVKTLKGLLPICSACKKIRDDQGYWSQIEAYISSHSDAEFSHSICPECLKKLYPDLNIDPVGSR